MYQGKIQLFMHDNELDAMLFFSGEIAYRTRSELSNFNLDRQGLRHLIFQLHTNCYITSAGIAGVYSLIVTLKMLHCQSFIVCPSEHYQRILRQAGLRYYVGDFFHSIDELVEHAGDTWAHELTAKRKRKYR